MKANYYYFHHRNGMIMKGYEEDVPPFTHRGEKTYKICGRCQEKTGHDLYHNNGMCPLAPVYVPPVSHVPKELVQNLKRTIYTQVEPIAKRTRAS